MDREESRAVNSATLGDYLFALPQFVLPHHLLSRVMRGITRNRFRPFKDPLIRWFIRRYGIDVEAAEFRSPGVYPDFDSFFTRALRPNARRVDNTAAGVACPVDGTVMQAGTLESGRLLQAKGKVFEAAGFLGGSGERAEPFRNGSFATLYLSPRDYHRVHMPVAGSLVEMVYVPGRLFSVNPRTNRAVRALYARNERVVTVFDTDFGPMAVVFVGALFVGNIETVWAGEVVPPRTATVRNWRYPDAHLRLERGQEMGRFHLGSTIVLLFGPGAVAWNEALVPGAVVKMGEQIGTAMGT